MERRGATADCGGGSGAGRRAAGRRPGFTPPAGAGIDERERDRRGVRDVEALDRAREVEAGEDIAALASQAAQPLALRPEDERQRPGEPDLIEDRGSLRIQPDPQVAQIAHFGQRPGEVGDRGDRYVLEPA